MDNYILSNKLSEVLIAAAFMDGSSWPFIALKTNNWSKTKFTSSSQKLAMWE